MLNDLAVKKEIAIHATVNAVWDMLTNPTKIKQYLFGTNAVSEWKEGSTLEFIGEWEGKNYVDKGTILKFEKNKIFQYNYWSSFSPLPDLPENYSVISFTLSNSNGKIILSLEQKGFADETTFKHSNDNWGSVLEKMKEISEQS